MGLKMGIERRLHRARFHGRIDHTLRRFTQSVQFRPLIGHISIVATPGQESGGYGVFGPPFQELTALWSIVMYNLYRAASSSTTLDCHVQPR